ncbi:MAG: PIN domain-containing protein [Bacillota bacterium]
MYFLDTNIFLRFLTQDDPIKAEYCKELLIKASEGKIKLFTSELVMAELVWVLQSPKTYNLKPTKIKNILLPIVTIKNLHFSNKDLYPAILDLFAEKEIDYIDAYNTVIMNSMRINTIFSYDRHFDKISTVKRLEPGEKPTN